MKHILFLTPSFSGGSWVYIEEIISKILKDYPDFSVTVLGLGTATSKSRAKYRGILYPRFDKYGRYVCFSPILSVLWYLPLFFWTFWLILFQRPRLVISNGFMPVLGLFLIRKIVNFKVIVTHQVVGSFRSIAGLRSGVVKIFTKITDVVLANSPDCHRDIKEYFPEERIMLLGLWANEIFFKGKVGDTTQKDELTIAYVGRLDEQKRCKLLIDIASENPKGFNFVFAGVGEYAQLVKKLSEISTSVRYLGYLSDKKAIKSIYREADVTWSFADPEYLAFPAIESLASGTPVLIPNIAVTSDKKISPHLVPEGIGWIVNYSRDEALEALKDIKNRSVTREQRLQCREYAQAHYSSDQISQTVGRIINL